MWGFIRHAIKAEPAAERDVNWREDQQIWAPAVFHANYISDIALYLRENMQRRGGKCFGLLLQNTSAKELTSFWKGFTHNNKIRKSFVRMKCAGDRSHPLFVSEPFY